VKRKAALLVIDVQRVYMEPEPDLTCDGDDLVEKCKRLIEKARGADVPIVYIQHRSEDEPDDPALVGIHPDLGRRPTEAIVEKRSGSAFFKTDLEKVLRTFGAKTLYVCGLATFGCVNATVMCALCKGYDTIVVRDAHGTPPLGGSTAAQLVDHFNAAWERAGATLVGEKGVRF
jgi:nicotinamidase-related amidase